MLTGIFEWAWSSGLWRPTPLILRGLADSCEFGLTKARPQDAARRLNLQKSKGFTNPDLNAMPTQRCQLVREKLELSDWQVQDSKTILLEYGNMSSATLPHVWERILRSNSKNQPIVSLAFGPGLTLFGAVFETV